MDLLGLRRAPRGIGSPGRYSLCTDCNLPVGATPNGALEAAFWIVGIVLVDHYLCGWIRRTINAALPATVLGVYPKPLGWLHIIDAVFGLALVAYSEEIVFRRCARYLFQIYLNDGYALVVVTSILFGAYHWWTGIGNIVEAILIGVLLMLFYRRSAALWPVVLAHYLTDVVDLAL
jgi:membrane protease YdiL (CAAX protease family)